MSQAVRDAQGGEQGQAGPPRTAKSAELRARALANPAFVANQWPPGQSGNPNGARPKVPILEVFEKALRRVAEQRGVPFEDVWDLFGDAMVVACIKDRAVPLMRDIVDRRDGPVVQRVEQNIGVRDVVRGEFERLVRPEVVQQLVEQSIIDAGAGVAPVVGPGMGEAGPDGDDGSAGPADPAEDVA